MLGRCFSKAHLFTVLIALTHATSAQPLQNTTLPLPVGTSNHGTPGLLCTPTKWTDIVLFYLFNYVAHAATVLTRPGERSDDFLTSVIGSLLYPAFGLYRGIEAILSGAVLVRNDDLRKAARSGALCIVVRGKDWQPVHGDEVSNAVFKKASRSDNRSLHILTCSPPWLKSKFCNSVYVQRQIIHGTYSLPEGYRFAVVPSDAQFTGRADPHAIVEVSSTYNIVKALIAIVQSVYALMTLYRARGDQIEQFGYAAFGLTVAPYAIMSVMNLLGNLCRPEYASLYLVESTIMDEARRRGGVFQGAVGRVREQGTTVCTSRLVGGIDAEGLRFRVDVDGQLSATFGIADPRDPHGSPQFPEKAASVCSSVSSYSRNIGELPAKLDYAGTENDALMIVPCCNPIIRGGSRLPEDESPSPYYHLTSVALSKPCWPFKHRDWVVKFTSETPCNSLRLQISKYVITAVVALTPLAVNGAMSQFQSGTIPPKESSTWRAYTIQWLILGVVSGMWWVVDQEQKDSRLNRAWQLGPLMRAISYIFCACPAVGGFVVVAQMLVRYGTCVWLGD